MSCQIQYKNGEVSTVLTPQGKESQLYLDALEEFGDKKKAIELTDVGYSVDYFKSGNTIEDVEPTLKDVLAYLDIKKSLDSYLTEEDRVDIKTMMSVEGFSTLRQLRNSLRDVFIEEGVFKVNVGRLIESGIYSNAEVQNIVNNQDVASKIQETLSKIEGELAVNRDIEVLEVDTLEEYTYKDISTTTPIGTYKTINPIEVQENIVKKLLNIKDRVTFDNSVNQLSYTSFIEKYNTDKEFSDSIFGYISNIKTARTKEIIDGRLVDKPVIPTLRILKNTLTYSHNTNSLIEQVNFIINEVDTYTWENNKEDIEGALLLLEKESVKIGIDIIGLSKVKDQREAVVSLLSSYRNVLLGIPKGNVTDTQLVELSKEIDSILPRESEILYEEVPVDLPINVIHLKTNSTVEDLFSKHGLIPLGNNFYHKLANTESKDDLYEYLYKNDTLLPFEVDKTADKPNELSKITSYINSKSFLFLENNQELSERVSLYRTIYQHDSFLKNEIETNVNNIEYIKTDSEYLKDNFVIDFYNYILEEKLKDSSLYKEALSKFTVDNFDISLNTKNIKGIIDNLESIKNYETLIDYIRIKKDSNMKSIIPSSYYNRTEPNNYLLAKNFPEIVPQVKEHFKVNGYLVVEGYSTDAVRDNGVLYFKVKEGRNVDIFEKVETNIDNNYFDTTEYEFKDNVEVDNLLKKLDKDVIKEVTPYSVEKLDKEIDNFDKINNITKPIQSFEIGDTVVNEEAIKYSPITTDSSIIVTAYSSIEGNNVMLGTVKAVNESGNYTLDTINLKDEAKGSGIGTNLFRELLLEANVQEVDLYQDNLATVSGDSLWNKAREAGLVTIIGGKEVISRNNSQSYIVQPNEVDVKLKEKYIELNNNLSLTSFYSKEGSKEITDKIDSCG